MINSKLHFFIIIVLVFSALPSFSQSDSPWRFSNRIQLSLDFDNNVEESLHNQQDAIANRLVFQTKIKRTGKKSHFSLGYHGGLSIYNDFVSENKLINEAFCNYSYLLTKHFNIGLKSFGRLKLFLNKESDYVFGNVSPFIQFKINSQNSVKFGYLNESLDYAKSIQYDFSHSAAFAQIQHRFHNGASLSLLYRSSQYTFDRLTNTLNLDFYSRDYQQDRVIFFSLGSDFMWRGFLINAAINYENNHSNSYGFEYERYFVNLMFAKNIKSFILRSYLTWQNKSYLDQFLPTWPIELDSEREQSNFFVLDISRDFSPTITGLVRLAWYNNESPWASFYYNKTLLSVGVELRFPHK
jgi:hypothetical protein